jgi:uncharacterized membrane protein (DUF485 family)
MVLRTLWYHMDRMKGITWGWAIAIGVFIAIMIWVVTH